MMDSRVGRGSQQSSQHVRNWSGDGNQVQFEYNTADGVFKILFGDQQLHQIVVPSETTPPKFFVSLVRHCSLDATAAVVPL